MEDRSLRTRKLRRIVAALPAAAIPLPVALVPFTPVATEYLRGQRLEPGQRVVPRSRRPVAARQEAALAEIAPERVERIVSGWERKLVGDRSIRIGLD